MTADEAIALGRKASLANEDRGLYTGPEVIDSVAPGLGERIVGVYGEEAAFAFAAGLTLGLAIHDESSEEVTPWPES